MYESTVCMCTSTAIYVCAHVCEHIVIPRGAVLCILCIILYFILTCIMYCPTLPGGGMAGGRRKEGGLPPPWNASGQEASNREA